MKELGDVSMVDLSRIKTEKHVLGKRYSGYIVDNDAERIPGMTELVAIMDKEMTPLVRRNRGVWLNSLNGVGAKIERHNEGIEDDDVTIVVFLTTLDEGDGGILVVHKEGIRVRPVAGQYVTFPSRQFHYVTRLHRNVLRVSVGAVYARA